MIWRLNIKWSWDGWHVKTPEGIKIYTPAAILASVHDDCPGIWAFSLVLIFLHITLSIKKGD